MDIAKIVLSDMRLVILLFLMEVPDYTLNEQVLFDALPTAGHKVSRDKLRTELAWLEEQGLIRVEDVKGMKKAELTARGADVACGAATCPGVKRPRPEA